MKRIVLNIPHSSNKGIENAGWEDFSAISEKINKWTDWHTDVIFNPNPRLNDSISIVKSELSRFVVDVERLVVDPLEKIGQGIVYTNFEGINRVITEERKNELICYYEDYINRLKNELDCDTMLIDCHSFPSDLCEDVDICIGYNEDWSKPSDDFISGAIQYFKDRGYKVGVNTPYSNSISPKCDCEYKSLMIEVNKRLYLKSDGVTLRADAYKIANLINGFYEYVKTN